MGRVSRPMGATLHYWQDGSGEKIISMEIAEQPADGSRPAVLGTACIPFIFWFYLFAFSDLFHGKCLPTMRIVKLKLYGRDFSTGYSRHVLKCSILVPSPFLLYQFPDFQDILPSLFSIVTKPQWTMTRNLW